MKAQFRKAAQLRQRAQGMAEYIIIVLVIAVLTIAVATRFGTQIRELFSASGNAMSGNDRAIDDKMGGSADVEKDIKSLGGSSGG